MPTTAAAPAETVAEKNAIGFREELAHKPLDQAPEEASA
jgi:hypothetical protein